ncbi:unnamed protein product [Gordionus sp. m RMFG-2023]|uniref:vacuolar protein sorting-associated protein 41 homolog n=1 Tax=Gordionus sp. m RMFG-2023 TaxID=3053472 RepID=UPI0030E148E6
MSEYIEEEYSENEESLEPRLKYERLGNDIYNILDKDSLSCFVAHEKFLAIGTSWGMIHIIDHLGNKIQGKDIATHSSTVNQISVDLMGEYIASCSHDGRIIITGLYNSEHNHSQRFDIEVKCIALNPHFGKVNTSKLFVVGLDKVIIYEKTMLGKKTNIIYGGGFGSIESIKWFSNYIAWNDLKAVKIYDTYSNSIIGSIIRDSHPIKTIFPCCIRWHSQPQEVEKLCVLDSTENSNKSVEQSDEEKSLTGSSKENSLLKKNSPQININNKNKIFMIGWIDQIKLCKIVSTSPTSNPKNLSPKSGGIYLTTSLFENFNITGNTIIKYVQIFRTVTTHFYICGLIPYPDINNIALLAYSKEDNQIIATSLASGMDDDHQKTNSILSITGIASGEEVSEFPENKPPSFYSPKPKIDGDICVRPQLHVINPRTDKYYEETVNDALSTKDWQTTKPTQYSLDYLIGEGIFFVASPKDIVLGRSRSSQDHVYWLLDKESFEEALNSAIKLYYSYQVQADNNALTMTTKNLSKSPSSLATNNIKEYGSRPSFNTEESNQALLLSYKVAKIYSDHLIAEGLFEKAALNVIKPYYRYPFMPLSFSINSGTGDSKIISNNFKLAIATLLIEMWTDVIYKFAKSQKLRSLVLILNPNTAEEYKENLKFFNVPPLNKTNDKEILVELESQCYHLIFSELLMIRSSPKSQIEKWVLHDNNVSYRIFLDLIKLLPSRLYDLNFVTNLVLEKLGQNPEDLILLQCLALLYTFNEKYEMALSIYIKLNMSSETFKLIVDYQLFEMVKDKTISSLIQLDKTLTLNLLIKYRDKINVNHIVQQLEPSPNLLLNYLDLLFEKDIHFGKNFHGLQVKLYAKYEPLKLMNFLKNSQHYNLHRALEECRTSEMHREMVFLYVRVGNSKKALAVMIQNLEDINGAINYCKEQDDSELWVELINLSINNPSFVTILLQNIGTYVDPLILIQQIQAGMKIQGLRDSLVKILRDYHLQTELRDSCNKILLSDAAQLFREKFQISKKSFTLTDDADYAFLLNENIHKNNKDHHLKSVHFNCSHCQQSLFSDSSSLNFHPASDNSVYKSCDKETSSTKDETSMTDNGVDDRKIGDSRHKKVNYINLNDIILYLCKHAFHHECLKNLLYENSTTSIYKINCPICSSVSQSLMSAIGK